MSLPDTFWHSFTNHFLLPDPTAWSNERHITYNNVLQYKLNVFHLGRQSTAAAYLLFELQISAYYPTTTKTRRNTCFLFLRIFTHHFELIVNRRCDAHTRQRYLRPLIITGVITRATTFIIRRTFIYIYLLPTPSPSWLRLTN